MKSFTIIKTLLIPFLMLLATHRGESLCIPKVDSPIIGGQDGCANIHNKFKQDESLSFSFSDVKACYESFAFDDKRRADTIDTMKKLYSGFYVFTDNAKEQPVKGLDYKAIDLINEIDNLKQKSYANDLAFSTDATNLITQLKDPHTLFFPICYTRFAFTQRLALYAATSQDGTQKIKVFIDTVESQNNDCEVDRIDGVAAIDAITKYARDNVFVSKDLGVRFNMALASLALQNGTYLLQPRSSQFTLRMVLPDKETVTYDLKCGTTTKTVTRNWEAVVNNPDDLNKFTDSKSYWKNFCANPPTEEKNQPPKEPTTPDVQPVRNVGKEPNVSSIPKRNKRKNHIKAKKPLVKSRNVAYPIDPLTVNKDLLKSLSPSVNIDKLVFETKIARFYMSDNDVGVAVLATYDIGSEVTFDIILNTFSGLQNGFKKLADSGAKKLVLDLSNNEGGLTMIPHFVNSLLFPDANPSLPTDFRLNDIVKGAISKSGNDSNSNPVFSFASYLKVNEEKFNDVNEFFASKFIENDINNINDFFTASQSSLPWKSSDMIILTNGFCGSACTSTSILFSELHGVKTVAVGGFPNTPLSFSSFPGGQAFLLDDPLKRGFDLKTAFGTLGLDNDPNFPKDMPTNTMLTFTLRRSFSTANIDQVLEFSFIPSTNHIFFDESSIRDPSKLWSQASALI